MEQILKLEEIDRLEKEKKEEKDKIQDIAGNLGKEITGELSESEKIKRTLYRLRE